MSVILVGVDKSERSEDALAFAHELAEETGARVLVASAFLYDDVSSRAANLEYRAVIKSEAERTARHQARRLADLGDRVTTATVARTSPAHGLQDLAASEHAALIVVGSTHVGASGRVLPGSTGERLLHGAPCAVAIVPKDYRRSPRAIRTVGVAWDGSHPAEVALRAAVDIARARAARLRVIRVADVLPYGSPAMMGGPSYVPAREEIERAAAAELDEVVDRLPDDVSAEGVFVVGDPVGELRRRSESLDLLITGSRGYGPLRAVLLGSVTGRLLRDAACPMIVVPRGVEAPLAGMFRADAAARS